MKILVVEDQLESRHLLLQVFSQPGHQAFAVADGREALDWLEKNRHGAPDAIISDALMPRMDGFRLCTAVRRDPRWCHLPFIFYTASYTEQADEQLARRIGADAFIVKPVEPDQLMAQVAATVTRVASAPRRQPLPPEANATMLDEYNRCLSLQLEVKVAELEGANHDLRTSEQAVRELNEQLTTTVHALEKEAAQRQQAEAAVRFREELLRHAQSIGHIGSWERACDSRDMILSDEACRIFGLPPGSLVSTEWILDHVHPEDRDMVRQGLKISDELLEPFECEHRFVRDGGQIRHVFVRRHLVSNAAGSPVRHVGIIQDITERQEAEAKRTRLEIQLRQAQKMEAIGNLAGGIAHDFNNVLTAIMAHAELLELELPRETTSSQLRDSVQEILAASSRARDMVRQILTFSRNQPVERRRLDLDRVVQDALKSVRICLPANVRLHAELHAGRTVLANEAQLHQIVTNLCTNALHALGDQGGRIDVRLFPADPTQAQAHGVTGNGEYIQLTIRDDGCGMDPATLERIFEPFFSTKSLGQGTGLGLAVVHGVIRAHEGTIAVESRPREGTSFFIYLPTVSGPAAAPPPSASPLSCGAGQKILFVDDEPSVAKIGSRLLERLGYQATALTDSVTARDRLVQNPHEFDLVITDFLMPRVTGLDLAKAVWAVRPDLPMILAMGFGGQLDAAKARAHGFSDFVAKPFAIQTLADAITRALQK